MLDENMRFVGFLTCQESDEILSRYEYEGWQVVSSLTDLDGVFGEPKIVTTWQKGSVIVEGMVPWPRSPKTPCTHVLYVEEEPDAD